MISTKWLIPLADARDISLVGGKAVNLARLIHAGLPVPGGFVISTRAFEESDGAVSAELAEEIRAAYRAMGSPLVAARSSATAEDMAEASMAGQYETFLNLADEDALIEAVADCWLSMRSKRLLTYLNEHNIAPQSVAMAVVVQHLVLAESAGVMFTADPQTGRADTMCIEAAWGLGEGVVSGAVNPDRIRVRENDGEVLAYDVAEKMTYLPPGGQNFQDVPIAQQAKACITYEVITSLWKLGRKVARHFDGPQDLEWAVAAGQVYLLQSRPITTLRETAVRSGLISEIRDRLRQELKTGRGPWVRHNLSETLTHATPLTWSLIRPFMSGEGGYGKMHEEIGFLPSATARAEGFLELIGGRVYMDCARMPEMFSQNYPFAYDLAKLRTDPDASQQAPSVAIGTLRERADAAAMATRVTAKLRKISVVLDQWFDTDFFPNLKRWCEAESKRDLTALSDEELAKLWAERSAKVFDEFGAKVFLPSMIEGLASAELRSFLHEHVWDASPEELLHDLVVGEKIDMTMASNALLQLVGIGKRDFAEWLADFGSRGPGEFDLANSRWSECPDDALAMARRLAEGESLLAIQERRREHAKATFEKISGKLSKRLAENFQERVKLASRYVRFREDGKGHLMQAYALLRPLALEVGSRLGIGEGIFLLDQSEMLEALRTGYVPKDRIAKRQLIRSVESELSFARVIDEEGIESLGMPKIPGDAQRLAAHPIANGTCAGPVRIVHSPESAGDLGKGYVLVCSSTDPSWTPLFVNAAGLVLECGGALSHGAIVARELGLPALVLDDATCRFTEGEILTLDAGRGLIYRGALSESLYSDKTEIPKDFQPPPVGLCERHSTKRGLMFACVWAVLLLLFYLLPAPWLKDRIFGFLDSVLWPLVPKLGMPGTVAVIAVFFGILPLILQKFLTDNERLLAARNRAATLRRLSKELPKESATKRDMEKLAAPVTMRILKASMTSLAFVLGPMMLIFLWLPERLDPASWNATSGQTMSILAELSGEWDQPITLDLPEPLEFESLGGESKTPPPIRQALVALRQEWAQASDTTSFPWELRATAEQVHVDMLGSLDQFLAREIPPQKLSWRIRVPEGADGHHLVKIDTGKSTSASLMLAFGNAAPPAPDEVFFTEGPVHSLKAIYPRALTKNHFWTPILKGSGEPFDFGWLGVYLFAYLPTMVGVKKLLRVA